MLFESLAIRTTSTAILFLRTLAQQRVLKNEMIEVVSDKFSSPFNQRISYSTKHP